MKTGFNQSGVEAEPKSGWTRFFRRQLSGRRDPGPGDENGVQSLNKGKVLIVDDDPVTLRALSFKLESRGYSTSCATDYAEAGALLRSEKHDVVLLDIHYPPDVSYGGGVPWDGYRIIRWLRNFRDIGQVPIILMSAFVELQSPARARAFGAADLLEKPIDSARLLSALELCMLSKQTPNAAPFEI